MQSIDALASGYYTINKHAPNLHRICFRCHSLVNQETLVRWNRTASWNKLKSNIVNHSLVLVTDLTDQASNAYLSNLLKDPFTRSKTEFVIGTKRDCIPQSSMDSIIHKNRILFDKQVFAISSGKTGVGIEQVWDKIPDHTALFGLVNSGKSSLINAFIKAKNSKEKVATVSVVPGTTLSPLSKKIAGKNIMELPGIDHPDNFMLDWDIKDLKLAVINKKMKMTEFIRKKPCSIFLGGFVRLDVKSEGKLKITAYSSPKLYIHKTSRGDELFKAQAGKLLLPPKNIQSLHLATQIQEENIYATYNILGGGWVTFESVSPVDISIYTVNGRGILRS
jgi:ribosome biogenesis GTPase A